MVGGEGPGPTTVLDPETAACGTVHAVNYHLPHHTTASQLF